MSNYFASYYPNIHQHLILKSGICLLLRFAGAFSLLDAKLPFHCPFNLFDNTLVNNLQMLLTNPICLKFVLSEALDFLGTGVMKVEFIKLKSYEIPGKNTYCQPLGSPATLKGSQSESIWTRSLITIRVPQCYYNLLFFISSL